MFTECQPKATSLGDLVAGGFRELDQSPSSPMEKGMVPICQHDCLAPHEIFAC
jgi:hypothetical protein